MSPIIKYLIVCICLVLTIACSQGTDSGKVFVPQQGHSDQWAGYLAVGSTDFHGSFVTSVPSDQTAGNGALLFVRHCSPCHGSAATGKIGPDILAILAFSADIPGTIRGTINAVPLMGGQSNLTDGEIQDIAGYLSALISGAAPVPAVRQAELCSQCHGVDLDGGIALVSCTSCHNGADGSVGHPVGWLSAQDDPVVFHGGYGRDFAIGCTTCHGVDLNGGVVFSSPSGIAPSCASCHNGVIAPLL